MDIRWPVAFRAGKDRVCARDRGDGKVERPSTESNVLYCMGDVKVQENVHLVSLSCFANEFLSLWW